ncbi:MAG TPA: hypothetical protein VM509_10295, partial [Planctomycetota bacterium]|nr:hypothetical protein [Planctomycetota bacterium]
ALAQGRVAELPRPKPRAAPIDVAVEVLVVRKSGALLFERRAADAARMSGLWELPTREVGGGTRLFRATWRLAGLECTGIELGRIRHSITSHRIVARILEGALRGAAELPPDFRWIHRRAAADMGLTGMTRKALALESDNTVPEQISSDSRTAARAARIR